MTGYSDAQIWGIIAALALGTFMVRLSFLALVSRDRLSPFVHRMLRYTPVAVLPAIVAPLVIWPEATGGGLDLPRAVAAAVTAAVAWRTRNTLWGAGAGAVVLTVGLQLTGG